MQRLYSQSTGSTYFEGIHAVIPADAVPITEERFSAVIGNASPGQLRGHDADGLPVLIPLAAPDLAQVIAVERFRREASGVTVGGLTIETTRDSQSLIASTGLSAVLNPDYRCNFKTVTGFVEIGADQIIAIATAVRAHVQACFDRERVLLMAIDAGEYSDDMLSEGWPDSPPVEPVELQ